MHRAATTTRDAEVYRTVQKVEAKNLVEPLPLPLPQSWESGLLVVMPTEWWRIHQGARRLGLACRKLLAVVSAKLARE